MIIDIENCDLEELENLKNQIYETLNESVIESSNLLVPGELYAFPYMAMESLTDESYRKHNIEDFSDLKFLVGEPLMFLKVVGGRDKTHKLRFMHNNKIYDFHPSVFYLNLAACKFSKKTSMCLKIEAIFKM